jgi:hypothetical protein
VTLAPDGAAEQRAAIVELRQGLASGFAVKDSFAALDLVPVGFRRLFAGEWFRLDAIGGGAGKAGWEKVEGAPGLAEWEAAWSACGSPAADRVFPPSLLADDRIAFFAVRQAGEIVAGCAANHSDGTVGFSNFFAKADVDDHRRAAVARVADFAGGKTVVGYESGRALRDSLALGFVSVGPLRVWLFEGG